MGTAGAVPEQPVPCQDSHRCARTATTMPGVPLHPWDPQPGAGVHSRGIDPLHPAVVADAVGGVPQVVALVVDAVGRLLVGQVPLHLVLGRPVGPLARKEQSSVSRVAQGFSPGLRAPTSIATCLYGTDRGGRIYRMG